MSAVLTPPAERTLNGGASARRAVTRWGWRLFRREWRQQLLVLALLAMAVAATIFGAGLATNTPPSNPNAATFGTALASVTLPGSDASLAADVAAVQAKYGPADVIDSASVSSGTVQDIQLRALNPNGRYDKPMLDLVSGRYPASAGEVALSSSVASLYNTSVGGTWHNGGSSWRVTGIVRNPSNLLDSFALVAPGQLAAPSQVTLLLGGPRVRAAIDSANSYSGPGPSPAALTGLPAAAEASYPAPANSGSIPPATVVLVVSMLGLIFIGQVSVAGFTVMAQRRLRGLGMLSAIGATEKNIRLVMVANGAVVGVVGALVGAVLGLAAWFAYVPSLQTDTGHVINPMNMPWWAVGAGIVLAILTSILAARRPARTMARVPVIAALSGRPATPAPVHRSAIKGAIFMGAGIAALLYAGGWGGSSGKDSMLELAGLISVVIAIFQLAPLAISALSAGAGPRMPVSVRIALRDLVRYRARSGAALAATTFAVFLSMLICVIASVRFSMVLDWTGENLTSSQLIVYSTDAGRGNDAGGKQASQTAAQAAALDSQVRALASSLHATSVLPLESVDATLNQTTANHNNFSGPLYLATPQLLADYGIKASQVNPAADILTMRPGMAGLPNMQMAWGGFLGPDAAPTGCTVSQGCVANPPMQTISSLPSGTSAPNTVITTSAVTRYHLSTHLAGWLIQTPSGLTSTQINAARQVAVANGVNVETKSGELGLSQISSGATALGLVLALGVLVMTVGLIRSETARDLRTLTATGARAVTRRNITAATAGALGLLGSILGMAGAVVAGLAWAHSSVSATFGHVPLTDVLLLLIGLPAVAAIGGWLLAGREPQVISRQPLELSLGSLLGGGPALRGRPLWV